MFIPMSAELNSILLAIHQIPETPMNDEFWNTPEMLEAASVVDFDASDNESYMINLSLDDKTVRQMDRSNDYTVACVLVGPELFGRIYKLFNERAQKMMSRGVLS